MQELKRHYEAKYAGEGATASLEPVRRTRFPADRYEAATTYVPRFFRGGDILELGAGDGRIAHSLLSSGLPIASYTAAEISAPRLDGLRRKLRDARVRVIELDAQAVPDEGPRYDAVLAIALVEHLLDPLRALQRVRRALRPGGFVYIDTPNIAKYTRRLKLLVGRFPATASRDEGLTTYAGAPVDLHDEGHLHYFTYRSLSRLLTERCGYSRVVKLACPGETRRLGRHLGHGLARLRPELFSELVLVARVS